MNSTVTIGEAMPLDCQSLWRRGSRPDGARRNIPRHVALHHRTLSTLQATEFQSKSRQLSGVVPFGAKVEALWHLWSTF